MSHMLSAAEPPAQNNLENAPVDTGRQPEPVTRIELPARVEIRIHRKEQLVLLNADGVELLEGSPGAIIFDTIRPHLSDQVAELDIRGKYRTPARIGTLESQINHRIERQVHRSQLFIDDRPDLRRVPHSGSV